MSNHKGLPETVFMLKKKLYIKAKQERNFDFMHCMIEFIGLTCLERLGVRLSLTMANLVWMVSIVSIQACPNDGL